MAKKNSKIFSFLAEVTIDGLPKGRSTRPNRLFFLTLFKRPLTPPPPPRFAHLCCEFFWRTIAKRPQCNKSLWAQPTPEFEVETLYLTPGIIIFDALAQTIGFGMGMLPLNCSTGWRKKITLASFPFISATDPTKVLHLKLVRFYKICFPIVKRNKYTPPEVCSRPKCSWVRISVEIVKLSGA